MMEYLILNGKFTSAKYYHQISPTPLKQSLLHHFTNGNRIQFMELFTLLQKQSKLQFYLRVYFLIFSIHPFLKARTTIPQPQKISFKDYLDNKGAELAKTNQFLQFYALPFIKKPLEHQAFKNLFKKQWIIHLKQKLQLYINQQEKIMKNQVSKRFQQQSSISAGSNKTKSLQQKVKQMQKINKKLFQQVKQFTQKYLILQDNHKNMNDGFHTHMLESQNKWFQITKQLVNCGKTLIQMLIITDSGNLSDRKFIKAKKRIQKYQKFVNKKFDDLLSQSQDISIFDKPSINQLSYSVTPHTQKSIIHHNHPNSIVASYLPTDYVKMKNILKKGTNNEKISVINGLYWRILKSKDKEIRKLNILGILHYDVLGIQSGEFNLMLNSRPLMKFIVRFIQLVSLDGYGKRALFINSNLHKELIGAISQCHDPICLQYIIDTLGQISSTASLKLQLIKADIIEVCVGILRSNKYQKNELILQNSSKDEGLKKFQKQKDIFDIFKRYLSSQYKITRVLIYGIIYSLLSSHELFKRAHTQKMPQFLDRILSIDPQINKIQFNYLKNKLAHFQPKQNEEPEQQEQSIQDDGDLEVDDEQIQESEQLVKIHEEILEQYSLKGKQANKQIQQVKEILRRYQENYLPKFRNVEVVKNSPSIHTPKLQSIQPVSIATPLPKQNNQDCQKLTNSQKMAAKGIINNSDIPSTKQNHKLRIKNAYKISSEKLHEERQNRRIQKSVSADRGILQSNTNEKIIYQSNKFTNNVSEFKPANHKSFQSPQQHKKSREVVLKELNEQLKAQQMMKQRKKETTDRQSRHQKSSKGNPIAQYGEIFQSRPKIRRTPPKQ